MSTSQLTQARPRGAGSLPGRLAAVLAVTLWLLLTGLSPALADSGTDRVTRLAVAIRLDAQGGMDVTETYDYQFNTAGRHGLRRYVTTEMGYDSSRDQHRHYALSGVRVSSPSGAPTDMTLSTTGSATQIRVGSPRRTVTGDQQYVLRYHLDKVVNKQQDGVELYWNVLGQYWEVPFDRVDVTVTGPSAISKVACVYGPKGSTRSCEATKTGSGASYSATDVQAGEPMTVDAMLDAGGFGDVSPDLVSGDVDSTGATTMTKTQARWRSYGQLGLGLGLPLAVAAVLGGLVWTRGRDERYVGLAPDTLPAPGQQVPTTRGGKAPPVAVRFTPPDDATPGLIGTVYDESADTIDVSATVIDLAVRGYLRIEQVQGEGLFRTTDWRLEYLGTPKAGDRGLLRYERTILDGIFAYGTPVMMSELKNRFASTLAMAKQEMYAETVSRGWFRRSPESVRRGLGCLPWVPFAAVFAWMFFGSHSFSDALDSDRVAGLALPVPSLMVAAAGLLAVPFIARWCLKRMPSRTADGSAVLYQAKGFREYLLTAEAEQIKYDEALDIFSRYLPYAVVFGVADRWAKVFARVAEMARAEGYDVGMPYFYVWDGGGFGDFADFGNAVDSFSSTAAGTFTSTPGSSGGSGWSSGGDFGGFSGGGGGDGGGGSW